jgi:ubiquinone/menaquinone biosynthesis C-methylase UbiE
MEQARMEAFVGQVVTDMAASMSAVMADIGRRLGLYESMAGAGPVSASQLAAQTGTSERYIREWLNNQAAGGYVSYEPASDRYELPEEHALVLANSKSPVFLAGGFNTARSMWLAVDRLADSFRSGEGIGWHEHDTSLHCGTEQFYRTGYRANLTSAWIPALDGMLEKLRAGAKVADVGCGHGASTIIMASEYPRSTFWGFDYHPDSIRTAGERASGAGVSHRIRFEVADAAGYPGTNYDLVCFMDSFHDLGDPLGAARHARRVIANDGSVLLVEPFAGDRIEENLNPVGRLYYAASTAICTPNSLSQGVGAALGAQAGQARLSAIFEQAGFRAFRRVAETPFNLVLEARP